MRDHLADHPRGSEPAAPLFPAMTLAAPKPTGVRAVDQEGKPASQGHRAVAHRQAAVLAELSVADAEERMVLDWAEALRQVAWYKAVYRPAVLRANRLMPTAGLSPELKFHSLRHTYASLYVAAGIPPFEISRFISHAKPTTTLNIYAHLFEDDRAAAMDALDAIGSPSSNLAHLIAVGG